MKRLGFFAVIFLILMGVYGNTPAYAALTQQDLSNLQSFTQIFNDINTSFGTRWSGMVQSVYDRFKDDPDVDFTQFKRYVLEGIPGATIPNQTGFIPMLNGVINGGGGSNLVYQANIALADANQMLTRAITAEQLKGGSITQQQASQQDFQASQTNAQKVAQIQQSKDEQDPEQCGLFDGNLIGCVDQLVAWIIKNTLMRIAGVILWLMAQLLDYSIKLGILNFKDWASNSLYPIWIVVRQIISLTVVFAGLWLGFMYIVGREDTFGKYIGWLVVFALFVNFSYPVTRALIDVSNIISLNIYTATVGDTFSTNTNSAGTLIMNKMGLSDLVLGAEKVSSTSKITDLNSTPNALVVLAFVIYAAYVFFNAVAIVIARTAVLVFLIVASPLLLIDSIIPKLGDVAMKMRELYVKQLVVAPVFMIMLALTLRFMDVFSKASGMSGGLKTDGAITVQTFFNVIMMIIMLHITLKVIKDISGAAGKFATNALGKVGGFGLAAATGGAGLLARGSIGQLAAGARDSAWMERLQGSRMGRGLYGISNSLAQSSFDARNVGVVSRGFAAAGVTGGLGMTMQRGSSQTYDKSFAERKDKITKKYGSMNNAEARQAYYDQVRNGTFSRFAGGKKIAQQLDLDEMKMKKQEEAQVESFIKGGDTERKQMLLQAQNSNNHTLTDKLQKAQGYFDNKAIKPEALGKLESEEVLLKKDLDKDTEHYKMRSAEFAGKELEHKKESQELDDLQKTITMLENDPSADKNLIAQKKQEFGLRKQSQEQKTYELQQMDQENKILAQNLEVQKNHYQEKKNLLDTTRSNFISSTAKSKASSLDGLDSKTAIDIIDKDPFTDHQKENLKEIQEMQDKLGRMDKDDMGYKDLKEQLNTKIVQNKQMVEDMRKAIKDEYFKKNYTSTSGGVDFELPDVNPNQETRINAANPGGSDMSRYNNPYYTIPAYIRNNSFRGGLGGRGGGGGGSGSPVPTRPTSPAPSGAGARADEPHDAVTA